MVSESPLCISNSLQLQILLHLFKNASKAFSSPAREVHSKFSCRCRPARRQIRTMLLKPRTLACAAPAELDTDAIRDRDSGMFDTIWAQKLLNAHVLISLNREVAGTLVCCAIASIDEARI